MNEPKRERRIYYADIVEATNNGTYLSTDLYLSSKYDDLVALCEINPDEIVISRERLRTVLTPIIKAARLYKVCPVAIMKLPSDRHVRGNSDEENFLDWIECELFDVDNADLTAK